MKGDHQRTGVPCVCVDCPRTVVAAVAVPYLAFSLTVVRLFNAVFGLLLLLLACVENLVLLLLRVWCVMQPPHHQHKGLLSHDWTRPTD